MEPPKGQAPGELPFALLLLAAGLVLAHQAFAIAGFSSPSSAGVFPMLAAGTMLASGAAIALKSVRGRLKPGPAGQFLGDVVSIRFTVFSSLMAGYVLLLVPLGFVASSFLFLVAGTVFLYRGRYLFGFIVSAATVAVIYVIFRYVFIVVLPRGTIF